MQAEPEATGEHAEILVGAPVAVVVLAVAALHSRPLERVAELRLAVLAGGNLVLARSQPTLDDRESVVHQAVAVVVDRVADLRHPMVDQGIGRGAVCDVRVVVAVVV